MSKAATVDITRLDLLLTGISWEQPHFREIALNPATPVFSDLMLGDGGKEAGCRPTFLVGLFGELRARVSLRGSSSSRCCAAHAAAANSLISVKDVRASTVA